MIVLSDDHVFIDTDALQLMISRELIGSNPERTSGDVQGIAKLDIHILSYVCAFCAKEINVREIFNVIKALLI